MSVSQWKRSSSAGLFARRSNKILKQIDWLLEKYHAIEPAKHLERKACLVAMVGQCNVWIESKRHKSSSSRMPAVIALRDQAQAVSDRARERWGKLRKLFVGSKNTTGAALKPLHGAPAVQVENSQPSQWSSPVNEYWLEAYGDDHIMGRELKQPFEQWLRLPEGEDRSFWEWLKQQPGYKELKSHSSVTYLDAVARRAYEIDIRGQQLFSKCEDGSIPYDTRDFGSALAQSQGAGLAIYVVSPDQKLYSAEGVLGVMHHSSFLSGAPVLAAGEIRCENGFIRRITAQSGHYRPGRDFAFNFLLFLRRRGINLRGIRSEIASFGVGDAHEHYRLLLSEFKGKMSQAALNVAKPSPITLVPSANPAYMMMGADGGQGSKTASSPNLLNTGGNRHTIDGQVPSLHTPALGPAHKLPAPGNHYNMTEPAQPTRNTYSMTLGPEPDPHAVRYSITRA